MLEGCDPRLAGVKAFDLNLVLGAKLGELLIDVLGDASVNLFRQHVGHRAD